MAIGNLVLLGNLTTWLTPLWLLSVGSTVGLAVLLVLYGLWWAVARKSAARVPSMLKESILPALVYLLLFLAGFVAVAYSRMPYQQLWASVTRVMSVGTIEEEIAIPPGTESQQLAVHFRSSELKQYKFASDQDVLITTKPLGEPNAAQIAVRGGEPSEWSQGGSDVPFFGVVEQIYITNESDLPATVNLMFRTDVEFPQVYSIPITATGVVAIFLLYFVVRLAFPQISAIANTASKQAIAQPVFYLAIALGVALLISFIYVPYNTFGEDVKMVKDSGMTLIMVLAIIVALWTASVSVADEIEGRTALTLLSKPISRRDFILGKFWGIFWPILIMFILLGLLFLAAVSYKVVYDARETSNPIPHWQACYKEMIHVVPGLTLAFMETLVLASISVAISTRLPMLANLVICASIYVLGHLVPVIVESSAADFAIVRFVGLLIATVIPVLDHFNIQAAVAAGAAVPFSYLLWAFLYCALYSSIMMLLALALFEDRDLA